MVNQEKHDAIQFLSHLYGQVLFSHNFSLSTTFAIFELRLMKFRGLTQALSRGGGQGDDRKADVILQEADARRRVRPAEPHQEHR
jgi:hypothetical protein